MFVFLSIVLTISVTAGLPTEMPSYSSDTASFSTTPEQAEDLPSLLRSSLRLYRQSEDDRLNAKGSMYAGFAYGLTDKADSSEAFFAEALRLAETTEDPEIIATVHNFKGLTALNSNADYYRAILEFSEGLDAARSIPDSEIYSILLANIAYTSWLRGDPEGMHYAQDCYQKGISTDNKFLIYIGAYTMAMFQYSLKEWDTALKYIKEAEQTMSSDTDGTISETDKAACLNLYGKICLATGDMDNAGKYLERALSTCMGSSEPCDLANVYLSYGYYYLQKGDQDKALGMFMQGVEAAGRQEDQIHLKELYKAIADVYYDKKDWYASLTYYRKFYGQALSLFDSEKERSLNELNVKYETLQKENEIQQHIFHIQRQEKRIQLLAVCLLFAVILLAGTAYAFKKRRDYWTQIVRQTQNTLKAREELEDTRGRIPKEEQPQKYSTSALSESMGDELFARLEKTMREERIYCDSGLSIQKLAELMGTNRTYMSQLINQHTGMNFNAYINKYRIEEAIRLISDTDRPLKTIAYDLGFSSLSTFYTYFKKEIGLPPSQYRERLISLKYKNGSSYFQSTGISS